ncbi:MAG: hypothetical protein QFX40_02475, partial [Archaeoglobales archaeon]|nr:hypothetical protein [Archaeoglobales archaeon]
NISSNQTKMGLKGNKFFGGERRWGRFKSDQDGIERLDKLFVNFIHLLRSNQTKMGLKAAVIEEHKLAIAGSSNQTKMGLKVFKG